MSLFKYSKTEVSSLSVGDTSRAQDPPLGLDCSMKEQLPRICQSHFTCVMSNRFGTEPGAEYIELQKVTECSCVNSSMYHYTSDVCHEKTDVKVFVVFIPKEGWVQVAVPILLLV